MMDCVRVSIADVFFLTDVNVLNYVLCVAGNDMSVTDYWKGYLK